MEPTQPLERRRAREWWAVVWLGGWFGGWGGGVGVGEVGATRVRKNRAFQKQSVASACAAARGVRSALPPTPRSLTRVGLHVRKLRPAHEGPVPVPGPVLGRLHELSVRHGREACMGCWGCVGCVHAWGVAWGGEDRSWACRFGRGGGPVAEHTCGREGGQQWQSTQREVSKKLPKGNPLTRGVSARGASVVGYVALCADASACDHQHPLAGCDEVNQLL